ncbi:patatin-like phospholipase domain-containing protein 4 isoform X2 [Acropora millepora]|uniref:patatin-like phospholipase domain-containing protein 4 isoform X2 n=1 Tax=Acropora millepora TaxID=45264 RepID=UPI001CF37691|nr:patatin-like phospholipase domain-containing protein 4 isoform X2 [Acropora millepora]
MNLSFAGCGFLAFYHLGVATCLSSHAPKFLKSVTAFAGASAGSLVATMLATSLPLNKCTDFVHELTEEARSHPLGPFNPQFDIVRSLQKGLELHLPSDSHKIASGRLYVSVTSLKERKNVIISEFESKEELIQVLLASCYIPFYAGLKFPQFKGQPWFDGGFSDNMPAPPKGSTVRVSPFSGEHEICPRDKSRALTLMRWGNWNVHVNRENLRRSLNILYPPATQLRDKMFDNGFNDALHYIKTSGINFNSI